MYVLRCMYVCISDFGQSHLPSSAQCIDGSSQGEEMKGGRLNNTQPTVFLVLSVYIIGSLTVYKHELGNTNSTTCIQG